MKKLLMFFVAVAFSGISWGQIVISGSNGADGNYASFTKAGGAFAALNASDETGATITISITGDVTDENGVTSLNSGNWTSITITPSGNRTISGASTAGSPLINLNGADNITINGLNDGSNSLTISNTLVSSTSGTSTIRFIADATNNTITNCTILGAANMTLATNGGTIYFATATTTGNDNNTISNCKIGPVGSNLPSKGIFGNGTNTSATLNNSNITINNCEIYDFFLTGGTAGIYVLTGNTEWNITNNKVYQTASRNFTSTGTMYGIYFANSSHGNNIQITGNTIGYASASGTGTYTTTGTFASNFAGIYLSASSSAANACNINNNTISDFSFTSSTGYFYGIQNASAASSNTININNNTIKNISLLTTTGAFYGISWGSATNLNILSNNVYDITRNGGGTTYGIFSALSSVNETINNNNIYNITSNTSSAASTIRGISQGTAIGTKNFQNNNIYNLTGNNGSSIIGILIGYATTGNISGNTIYNLSSTGGTSVTLYGIQNTGTSVTTMNIYQNNIYNLSMTSTGGNLYGILASAGTTNNIYNNFVSDLKTPAVNSSNPLSGIHISGGTNANVYFNTVYLNATSTGALFGSQAIFASTTPTLDMRNNIFVNVSTPNGATGYAVAYRRSSTTLTTYSNSSNNNCFYTPGGTNQGIFYDGTNFKQSMSDYKTWVSSRDMVSFSEDVDFFEKATPPYDLRIKGGSPTQCESGGQRITTPSITTDFYGTIRAGETGYTGTGSLPDVGAYEAELIPLDLVPPSISYTPLANTSNTSDRTLSATITDASGVDAAYLYWNVNSGVYQPVQGINTSGNTWEFTFGGGVNPTDVVTYYIVAQDVNKNVVASPNAGVTSYNSDPPSCSPDPTNPSTYTIVEAIFGDKTIGSGKDYETLTAAFTDIATKEVTGSINLLLTDTYTGEAAHPLVINPVAGLNASTTITIKPDVSQTINLTGTSTTAIIRLAGADYIIIDGSNNGTNTKDLTITNNATSGAVILLSSLGNGAGATYNTIKNCNIVGGTTTSSSYGISIGGSTAGSAGADNDNNTITDNNIGKVYTGIYAAASTTANATDNLTISNNTIGNDVDANSVGNVGIQMLYCNNSNIVGNTIKNLKVGLTPKGILLSTGVTNTTVDRNNINKIWYTGTAGYGGWGINVNTSSTSSNITLKNNIIYDIMGDGWNTITGSSMAGIVLDGTTGGINIYNNTVNLSGNYTRAANATITAALFVNSSLTNLDIRNNVFTNSMVNTGNTGAKAYAIYSSAAYTAFTNINYNDYFVSGTQGVLGYIASDRTDLAGIQAGFGQNVNSINSDPVYTSATDLTPTVADLNGAGVYISSVGYDYFNITRSNPPDLGAIEFTPPSYDAGIMAMASPGTNICNGLNQTVTFTVKNYSTSDIDLTTMPITVSCSVTGPNPQTFGDQVLNTGMLLAGTTQNVTFSTNYDMTAGGTYQFTATLTMNNDGNAANNTLIANRTVEAPIPLDYTQNFNASTSLPTGWSGNMIVLANHGTSSSNGLTFNLYLSQTSCNSTSAKIGDVGANSLFKFDYRIVNWSSYPSTATTLGSSDIILVKISTDCGASYTTLYTINNVTHTPSTSFVTKSFDLSAYAGNPVIIKFEGTWGSGDYYFDVDNFAIINIVPPTVTTTTASAITGNSATSGGNVTSDGNSTVTARGVCWSTSPNPTIIDDKTIDGTGTGSFTSYLTNLNPSTKYYYRAYATNSLGTSYGAEYDFTTLSTYPPTVVTNAYSNLTNTDVTLNGEITGDGGDPTINESGFVYSTTSNPMIGGTGVVKVMTNPLVDNGNFDITITGLTPGQTYYYKAYAINNTGTGYGSQSSFTMHNVPSVTTSSVTPGTTTANGGGNVTSDGGAPVTARGICWSTSANPTLSNSFTVDGNGTGSFNSSMTGLLPNATTYYVRAYATNAYGTVYGNQITFQTNCELFNLPLTENFNSSSLPGCWSTQNEGTGITERWSVSNTSNAGGSAYEMKCTYQQVNPATTRLITPAINTTGLTSVKLSFKHMLDAYASGVTLKVQSSTDKINWTDESWSVSTTANNIAATTVTLFINNNVGSQTYIAFVATGDLYQIDFWYIDNVSVTIPQANLWTGAANNAWDNTANWDNEQVPASNANVTIPATAPNYPTVNTPTTINKLTIESSATGTGSLLDNGNLTVTNNSSIKRYISGNKWHLLSSPVANALSGVFHLTTGQADIYIREYDPNSNTWSFITNLTTPLAVGKGYGIWADTQTNSTPDPVVTFNGQFNTGTINIPLVPNAWQVIGNPYPSALNWTLVDKTANLLNSGSAYFWRQSLNGGNGGYAAHDGVVASNGATNIIPPMQGFFVKANSTSLTFDNSMRLHTTQQLYNKSTASLNDMIRITASNGANYTDEALVIFNSNATNGFDTQFDALKLFSNNINAPEIYTVADNNKLVFNRFGSYPAAIPLNVRLGVNANITLTASEFDNYDANISIKLEDMLTGTIQDLRQNPSYTFAANIGENNNRFVIHFAQITGINENNGGNVSIYAYENTIYVNTNEKVKDISVYNMLGQLINSVDGNGKSIQTISLKDATAYYIVKVTTDKGVRTEKVFIK